MRLRTVIAKRIGSLRIEKARPKGHQDLDGVVMSTEEQKDAEQKGFAGLYRVPPTLLVHILLALSYS